jgi:hypothetical protein
MPYSTLIPLMVATLTAIITVFGLITTRGSKISEFRQAWIDAQRDDIAAVAANAQALASGPVPDREKALLAFDLAAARIRLRENPKKKEWSAIIARLAPLRGKLASLPPLDDVDEDVDAIIGRSQWLLKTEWTKVKRGETGYRLLLVSVPLLVVALAFLAFSGLGDPPGLEHGAPSGAGNDRPASAVAPAPRPPRGKANRPAP